MTLTRSDARRGGRLRAAGAAVLAAGLLLTAACGQGAAPASAGASEHAAQRHLFVVVGGDKVTGPDVIEARTGETVQIVVTSDVADELHVHGYDRTAELVAGRPSTLTLAAGLPGVFEVEVHENGLLLTRLRVR
ncbi:hypothetical protein DP939_32085 [Spongiactinospora rosea]|uniref:Cupredoxin-like protein n=1 Tax=Spongiactinospora rosea TaxID=2248750 RepID=A0A366LPZ0_9ACTN|nr:hypothetical protein [Spongiactinospora rosea]RBQ15961.1 hypothetical protein DP939_32085 [Spongiactinospora rosea]